MPGEDLGDEDVGDVLLALDDDDARVGQRRRRRLDARLGGSERFWPVTSSTGTVILPASSGSSRAVVSARTSRVDGVRGGDASGPGRGSLEGVHILVRQQLELAEDGLDDRVAVAGGQQRVHAVLEPGRQGVHAGSGTGQPL
jgi:hypothetical protein